VQNLTMRTSWALVIGTFFVLILALSALSLFILDQGMHSIALLAETSGDLGKEQKLAFSELAALARLLIISLLGIALVAAVLVFWGVNANVLEPLRRVVAGFDAMAYGDLSVPLERFGRNELGQLSAAVRGLQRRLSRTVALVRMSSDAVHRGAQHIASGNNQVSARTQQQVAQLKKTGAQIAALSVTVKRHADHAREARHLTESAARSARVSGETVAELVATLQQVGQDMRRMSGAIELVDTIASQANRIALLASVEAAQAGESGHGFKLIATEVQGLSQRSAETAQTVRSSVECTSHGFSTGLLQSGEAERAIAALVSAIDRVSSLMDGISSGSAHQSQGIEQLNRTIATIDQDTQRNADLVRQDAKAADQVEAEAERLKRAVSVFKLAPEVEQQVAANRYDEAAEWMQTLTPDDLANAFRSKPRRRRAA
jgi:methyl-accepting chemotaxis protein